uniref:Uncharacterized protein n=1 Tax=Avena sativa TaxID=4498 RepID=A0ACD5Y015_AVESA
MLLRADVCFVFAAALKEPSMRVQAAVTEAIALLAHHNDSERLQDSFAQTDAVRLLLGHLDDSSSRTSVRSRNTPPPGPMTSLHSFVRAKMSSVHQDRHRQTCKMHSVVLSVLAANKASQPNSNGPTGDQPEAKARMKAMAAMAVWKLARGHAAVCQSITESGALVCFARLLDSGVGSELRFYSAMTIMEITRVAELNLALRQSAFKPAAKAAVTEQLLRIVPVRDDYDPLLLPCITSLGCLSRTFTASQTTRVVGLLVELLDNRGPSVTREAILALTKFACTQNHLHVNHSRAIVDVGGAQHLVLLVYLGDRQLQTEALILLCCIALNVPEKEELAQAGVLAVLMWASEQVHLVLDDRVETLRTNAVGALLD